MPANTCCQQPQQHLYCTVTLCVKGEAIPGGLGLPEFLANRRMQVAMLSALRTGRLYPPGDIPGTHFC